MVIRRESFLDPNNLPVSWTLMKRKECDCGVGITADRENSVPEMTCPDGCVMTWGERDERDEEGDSLDVRSLWLCHDD